MTTENDLYKRTLRFYSIFQYKRQQLPQAIYIRDLSWQSPMQEEKIIRNVLILYVDMTWYYSVKLLLRLSGL